MPPTVCPRIWMWWMPSLEVLPYPPCLARGWVWEKKTFWSSLSPDEPSWFVPSRIPCSHSWHGSVVLDWFVHNILVYSHAMFIQDPSWIRGWPTDINMSFFLFRLVCQLGTHDFPQYLYPVPRRRWKEGVGTPDVYSFEVHREHLRRYGYGIQKNDICSEKISHNVWHKWPVS